MLRDRDKGAELGKSSPSHCKNPSKGRVVADKPDSTCRRADSTLKIVRFAGQTSQPPDCRGRSAGRTGRIARASPIAGSGHIVHLGVLDYRKACSALSAKRRSECQAIRFIVFSRSAEDCIAFTARFHSTNRIIAAALHGFRNHASCARKLRRSSRKCPTCRETGHTCERRRTGIADMPMHKDGEVLLQMDGAVRTLADGNAQRF
jgi:hypothetical protein